MAPKTTAPATNTQPAIMKPTEEPPAYSQSQAQVKNTPSDCLWKHHADITAECRLWRVWCCGPALKAENPLTRRLVSCWVCGQKSVSAGGCFYLWDAAGEIQAAGGQKRVCRQSSWEHVVVTSPPAAPVENWILLKEETENLSRDEENSRPSSLTHTPVPSPVCWCVFSMCVCV